MPKKPPRFPSHIEFPKHGAPRRVVEALPRTQRELEIALGEKFVGALSHFHGIQLSRPTAGTEPADLECMDSNGATIHIQIVEAVDENLRQLVEMRTSYLAELKRTGADLFTSFSGCEVSIVDTGDPPYLPKTSTAAGRRCLDQIRTGITKIGLAIGGLPVGRLTRRDVIVQNPDRTLSLLIRRHEPPSEPLRVAVSWGGGGPSYRTDVHRDVLPRAIRFKLNKKYVAPFGRFFLLIYSIDTLLDRSDPDVSEARRLLSATRHPFTEAWYLYPYADARLGHVVQLFPSEPAG